jgi:hypothetical protein
VISVHENVDIQKTLLWPFGNAGDVAFMWRKESSSLLSLRFPWETLEGNQENINGMQCREVCFRTTWRWKEKRYVNQPTF